jgi:hypothetical protein
LFVGSVVLQCILRSVRLLWVAYVVLVGIVGLVGGQHVWSRFDPMMNPCHERAKYPALCALGQTCYNPAPRKFECMGVAFPWSSVNQSNIKVWFDASDINGNGIPDVDEGYAPAGGLVNEWVSRVGGISATAVGSAPSFGALSVGGKPSVHFTGQVMFSSTSIGLSTDFAIFVVIQSSTRGGVLDTVNFDANTGFYLGSDSSSAAAFILPGGDVYWQTPNVWATTTTPKTGGFYSDGTKLNWRTNGLDDGNPVSLPGLTRTSRFSIGARNTALYFPFNGYIAEIIIMDGILPLSQVQAVEQYLMSKYSIT